MAMSTQDQLSFAEQGIQLDKARVDALTAQRDELAQWGGDTSNLDASIAEAQRDVDAGIDDVLELQGQADREANTGEGDILSDSDNYDTDPEVETEELDQDEQDALDADASTNPGDDGDPYVSNGESTIPPADNGPVPIYREDQLNKPLNVDDGSDPYVSNGKSTIAAGDPVPKPRPNPLHDYATYTYSIALYILTDEDINTLTTNPGSWSPNSGKVKQCLIASGGKNVGQWARNTNFTEDFYFQDLKMQTVIGLNNRSKATNAVDIGFTVLEPYGMSLLDRVMAVAEEIRAPNFKAMPYLLEIEFYGYDDNGRAVKLDSQRKRIPIQIIEMKIKASTKGAEYAIKAVPWNHQALSQSAASVPVNFEVKASTVGDFFYNNKSDQDAVSKQDSEKMAAQSKIQRSEDSKSKDPNKAADARPLSESDMNSAKGVVNHAFAVSSFCGGVNAWYTDLILKKLRATKDEIFFNVHEDIASTKIVAPENKDISRSAVKEDSPAAAAKAANRDANKVFTDASAFPISAGTSIMQVIDMVMRNSEYITSQIKDPKNTEPQEIANKEGKPLNWYKVIPTVEVGKYDYAMNKFSTKTTYHIVPYKVYDSKHPNGPSTSPKGASKKYHYSYTGKNSDVIDFQIDFDTLFYTAVTAGAAKWQAEQIQKAAEQKDDAAKVAADSHPAAAELVNRQLRLVSSQPQASGGGGVQNGVKPIQAADIQKGQYSNSKGDMLNLKLKITGDPEMIKQDDIYTNPAQGGYETQAASSVMSQNGSIPMDAGEVIAEVEFRTIVDMNDATGNPEQDPKYAKNSTFTGFYRILTVDNVFAGGKFEQTVDMVRLPDVVNNSANAADKGKQTTTSESMGADKNKNADPSAREPETYDWTQDGYWPVDEDANPDEAAEEDPWGDLEAAEMNGDELEATDTPDEDSDYADLADIEANTETVDYVDWETSDTTIESKQVEADF